MAEVAAPPDAAVDDRAPLRPAVVAVAALSALSSGIALVASILTDRPLWLTSTFVFLPGLVALVGLSVVTRREQQELFLARLRWGAVAGFAGTLAYDVLRWAVESSGLASTNSFLALPVFGMGLTGADVGSTTALAAGWVFHFANGVGFAIAYFFLAAGRRPLWGVLYALVLEAFMVTLYPGWLAITPGTEFLSVSVTAHVAYGAVLGFAGRRCP